MAVTHGPEIVVKFKLVPFIISYLPIDSDHLLQTLNLMVVL